MQGAVKITNISKTFGDTTVLNNVSLTVKNGEFLSILGPSGCGKSTLLRIIAGLEEPSGGDVEIGGRVVTQTPVWRRKIGFVFQNFALWPHLSVLRNVSMGLELTGVPKIERNSRAIEALRMVQLDAFADRLPSQLSGGQQQRVAIARAIVLKPEILLMDEPLSALDKNLRQDMQVELKALQHRLKLTTIFVTHDQEEAMSLSDRIVVMNKGIVEQVDTPEGIYNRPASQYVARFVGETSFFEGQVEQHEQQLYLNSKAEGYIPIETAHAKPNATGTAFLRPEWVTLRDASFAETHGFPVGKVEQIMFFGATKDYLVRFRSALIRVSTSGKSSEYGIGDLVGLQFIARMLP
jgi:ABC-type Fe3+/spermidine/putrescine transport system ATPase subunit